VAYSFTVIGFLHGTEIESITGSDSGSRMLEFARKNLSLLTTSGLSKRIEELKRFVQEYKKQSHKEALESAYRLQSKTRSFETNQIQCFQFNAVGDEELPKSLPEVDMVITDLPYGKLARWEGRGTDESYVERFLEKLEPKLGPVSVTAIIHDKKQRISHSGYKAIRSFALGKRRIVLLELERNLA